MANRTVKTTKPKKVFFFKEDTRSHEEEYTQWKEYGKEQEF